MRIKNTKMVQICSSRVQELSVSVLSSFAAAQTQSIILLRRRENLVLEKKHARIHIFWSQSSLCTLSSKRKTVKFSGGISSLSRSKRSALAWFIWVKLRLPRAEKRGGGGRKYRLFGRRQKYFVQRLLGINQTESQSRISPSPGPGIIISFEWRK